MSGKRYSDELKADAAKQVIDLGRSVREVSTGWAQHRLAVRVGQGTAQGAGHAAGGCFVGGGEPSSAGRAQAGDRGARHPKKGRRVLCQGVRAKYAFMQAHLGEFRAASMCRVLGVQRSGFYAWQRRPQSDRQLRPSRLSRRVAGLLRPRPAAQLRQAHPASAAGGAVMAPAVV
jgi:hypothetical protein